ncbi:hypothetical protein N431DRAFT_430296 [Stipitochalara longipes BDJ]|nr:hypothetical protein N431DRAFT_430296 [Stipitochalara longipes BDJ]
MLLKVRLLFPGSTPPAYVAVKVQRFSNNPSKLGIGIDLATTRCCLATGQRLLVEDHNAPDVKLYGGWEDSYEAGSKWPITAVLYNSQKVPKTGNGLEMAFKGPKSRNFDMERHFRQWKLLFHDDQSDPTVKTIRDDLFRKLAHLKMTRLDLLRDWVKLIYKDLLVRHDDGLFSLKESIGRFDMKDIEIAVTVPPGRSVLAHDQVHEAFMLNPIGRGQVFLVSEPEAMFRSWLHDGANPNEFKIGGRYMVVDGGGGTCCIVRFRLEKFEPSLGFEQEYESESLVGGAESISNLVEEKIGKLVAQNKPNRTWLLDQFRRRFDEHYKRRFGHDDDDDDNFVFQAQGEEVELSRQDIADCFDICIEKLFRTMDRHLRRGLPVQFLVLGGGLFASPYVMRAVEKHFKELKICRLSADKGHVARGAVLVRACAPFIVRRPILRSKAVTTFVKVTDKIRNSPVYGDLYTQTDDYGGEEWYLAAQWLAKQGTEAMVKKSNDMYEVASESSFKDARRRYFDKSKEDITFGETILTFNHTPPANEKLIFQLKNGTWVTLDGTPLPTPETSEKLKWNLKKVGIDINNLETSDDDTFWILRYSIQMQMREVGTKYWVKTWSWTKPAKTKGRIRQILLSEAHYRQALFTPQEISKNLAVSYELGPGTRKQVDNYGDRESEILGDQNDAITSSSTTTSLSNQTTHIASALSTTSRTAIPRISGGQVDQVVDSRRLSAPISSLLQDPLPSPLPPSQDRQPSHSPMRIPRPTQRLIKENNEMSEQERQSVDRVGHVSLPRPVNYTKDDSRRTTSQSIPAYNHTNHDTSIRGSQSLVRRKAYAPKAKPPLQPRKVTLYDDEYDIYDDLPPSPKRVRIFSTLPNVPNLEEKEVANDDSWMRRSARQREPTTQAADMVMWDDIDAKEYDVASETAESE